ncbi:MAG: DNA gyrase subunit A [Chloroflexota bacterium]
MEIGLVHKIDIDREMQQAYLDYAMSVIVSRALPDARDGLKPVHRRILYAMYDMGLRPDSGYKKSARIVGEVLGKYHPHGDAAVYDAMARLAQDFSMRYMLVDGQGNFGSVDGDPPAAMRYTEARLASPATNMLADIQKNTVNFGSNFDDTLKEPLVLPAAVPNLLVNGATGIAVGMATSIPPHNLVEVVQAMQHMLANWETQDNVTVEDLMEYIKGPDFPTGGVLVHAAGEDGLVSAYSTGKGQVTIQARAHQEEMERGRSRLIITELPYMTNKSSLIERIADLVREEKIDGISDLRDESDRQGMRIVIELSKNGDPEKLLRDLYKHTPMQSTFSIIMLALVEGEPRMLSLKQALRVYLEHRLEIVRRRSEFDLEKAQARAHILEGLRIALKFLDEVIEIIRKAPDVETARARLIKRFKLSDVQAQAILDLPLRRLAALERKKIEDEYQELQALIHELEALLRSPQKMRQVVGDELNAVKDAFGDRRRTHIVEVKAGQSRTSLLSASDMVPEKDAWLIVTGEGLISRTADERPPRLNGREAPAWLVRVNSRDTLFLAGENGEAAAMPVHAIPETAEAGQGAPLDRVTPLKDGRPLAAVFSLPRRATSEGEQALDWYVMTVTRGGMVKKTLRSDLPGPSANLFTLVKVNEGDRLAWAGVSSGQDELLLATAGGMAIRFSEEEVRPMGLAAAGVSGIKLAAGDMVAGAALLHQESDAQPLQGEALLVSSNGLAKRVELEQFPRQGRYGLGLQAWKMNPGEMVVGLAVGKPAAHAVLHLNRLQPKAIRFDEAPLLTRAARGKALMELKGGDVVLRLAAPSLGLHMAAQAEAPKPTAKPAAAKPAAAKPAAAKPAAAKPAAAKPAAAKPAAAKPATAKPATTKPATAKPATAKPATAKPATTKPAAEKPAAAKPATAKPAAEKPPAAKPAVKKAAASKTAGEKPPAKKEAAPPAPEAAGKKPAAGEKPAAGKKPAAKKPAAAAPEAGVDQAAAGRKPKTGSRQQLPLPTPTPAEPAPPKKKTGQA